MEISSDNSGRSRRSGGGQAGRRIEENGAAASPRRALLRWRKHDVVTTERGIEERCRSRESARPLRTSDGGEHEVVVCIVGAVA